MTTIDGGLRFEDFTFDADTGELTRGGVSVARLQEQPARVLAALLSRPGHLITRDELHRLLWPENSLVDADNGLNIAINKIRLALNDSASRPRFIQTVPRRGYQFIGRTEAQTPIPIAEPTVASVRRGWRLLLIGAGLLVLALTIVVRWAGPPHARVRSAAVLPFTNMLGDHELDYAVASLSDTLSTELAARGIPRVIAPEAAAAFKHRGGNPGEAARALHADALVVGTVVRDGASFSVNVRLIDGESERQLWARRFVRAAPMEITFSEDIASAVVGALGIPSKAPDAGGTRPAVSAAARDQFLRARYFWNLRSAEGVDSAVDHLTAAIEMDRTYASAWAGLADVYAIASAKRSHLFEPWPGRVDAGIRAAEEALRLDPSLGEAHAALGKLRMAQWRWADAEQELSLAVRLAPSYATARQWYGTLLSRLQKCPAAIEQTAAGAEIDPITPVINEAVGTALSACGQPERAIVAFKKVLALHSEFATAHMRLAGAYLRSGQAAASLAEYREALRLRSDNCEFQARMVGALVGTGDRTGAHELAHRIVTSVARDQSPYCAAIAYANIGDIDRAFAALDAVVAAHGPVDGLLADYHLRLLRSDPRWPALIDRVGLTPYARVVSRRP